MKQKQRQTQRHLQSVQSTELGAATEHSHSAEDEETKPEDGDHYQVNLAVAHRVGDGHRPPGLRLHFERERKVEISVVSTVNIVAFLSRRGGNVFRRYWIGLA